MPILLLILLATTWLPAHSRPQWTPVPEMPVNGFLYDRNSIKRDGDITSVNVSYTAKNNQVQLVTWNYHCKSWMSSTTFYSVYAEPRTDRLIPIPPDTLAEVMAEIVCPK